MEKSIPLELLDGPLSRHAAEYSRQCEEPNVSAASIQVAMSLFEYHINEI